MTILIDEMKTAPAVILNFPNIILNKFSRKKNILPLKISTLIVGILICLPSIIIVLILGEKQQLRDIGFTVFTSLILSYLSVIAMYIDLNLKIIKKLKQKIIPSLSSKKDLSELNNCIQFATSYKYVPSIIIIAIIIGLIAVIGGTLAYKNHPGFGLPLSAIIFGILEEFQFITYYGF